MTYNNKKLLLLVLIIGAVWFLSNYTPKLYLFGVTTLPDFPKLISASCSASAQNPSYDNPPPYHPNIPSLYGDYVISTEVGAFAKGESGVSNGNRGSASAGISIGRCGVGIGAIGCQGGPSYSNCNGHPLSETVDLPTTKLRLVTNTEDNTQKCYINDVLISTQSLPASGIGITIDADVSCDYKAAARSSISTTFLTIEDTSSKRFVEYNIYDTFDEPTLNPSRWTSSGTLETRFGKVYLNPGTLNMLENMKGRIVYFEYETTGIGSISLSDSQGNSYTLNLGGQEAGVIKLESSPLYPDKMYWFFRGKQVKEIDYSTVDKVTFSISGTNVFIDNVGFRVLFQTCSLGKNQFLAYETFTGPRTISHYSARKTIQQYCINLPPTLKKGAGFEEVPELIGILANGKIYNVASGDTVILPYIYTKTDTETLPCIPGSGQIFDVETNTCKDINGITFFCSEGAWNPASHTCEIYPELKYICDGTLDLTDPSNPICLWHPPEQAVCEHPDATYDYITGKCLRYPPSAVDCDGQEIYDQQRDACISNPIRLINCPLNTAYDSQLDKCVGTREIILNNKTIIIRNETYVTLSAEAACKQSGGRWDIPKRVCVLKAPEVYDCPQGSTERFIEGGSVCIKGIPPVYGEEPGTAQAAGIPLWMWIIGGIFILYFIFEIGPNRGFLRRK